MAQVHDMEGCERRLSSSSCVPCSISHHLSLNHKDSHDSILVLVKSWQIVSLWSQLSCCVARSLGRVWLVLRELWRPENCGDLLAKPEMDG